MGARLFDGSGRPPIEKAVLLVEGGRIAAELKRRGICLCPTLMREVSTFTYADEPDFSPIPSS